MASAKQRKQQARFKKAAAKAKRLYKSGNYSKYSDAMKAALSGTKVKVYQTGKSVKKNDSDRSARKPGKRKSRSGGTYTERRKNRSDMPGKLTGIPGQNKVVILALDKRNNELAHAEKNFNKQQSEIKTMKPGKEKNAAKKIAINQNKFIGAIKKDIRTIRGLIR